MEIIENNTQQSLVYSEPHFNYREATEADIPMLCEMEAGMLIDSGELQKLDPSILSNLMTEYVNSHYTRSVLYLDKQENEVIGVTHFSYSLDPFSFISSDFQSIVINRKFRGQRLYPSLYKFVVD